MNGDDDVEVSQPRVKVKTCKEHKQNLKEIKATHKLKSLASFANSPIFITTPSSILT